MRPVTKPAYKPLHRGSRFERAQVWIQVEAVRSNGTWAASLETANVGETWGLKRRLSGRLSHASGHSLCAISLIAALRQVNRHLYGAKPTLVIRSSHPTFGSALKAALKSDKSGEQLRIGKNLFAPLAQQISRFQIVEIVTEVENPATLALRRQCSQMLATTMVADRIFSPEYASE